MCIEDKYVNTISVVYPVLPVTSHPSLPRDERINSHITVSVLGEISDFQFSKGELIAALQMVNWEIAEQAEVKGAALYGPNSDFLVLQLQAEALQANYLQVSQALFMKGIPHINKYANYSPHLTLMHDYKGSLPASSVLPSVVQVGVPTLWWGTEAIPLI